eukprot:6555430-Prymnesium_polylepis.1
MSTGCCSPMRSALAKACTPRGSGWPGLGSRVRSARGWPRIRDGHDGSATATRRSGSPACT